MVNIGAIQSACFRLGDAACSVVAFIVAYEALPLTKSIVVEALRAFPAVLVAFSPSPGSGMPPWSDLWWIAIVVTLAMALALEYGDDSKAIETQKPGRILLRQAAAMAFSMGAVATVFYTLRVPPYSRLFLCSYIGWLFAFTVGYRLFARACLGSSGDKRESQRRTIIAGRPEGIEQFLVLAEKSGKFTKSGIAGCLLTAAREVPHSMSVPVLGEVFNLGDLLIHDPIDEVVVLLPNGETPWLADAIERCDYFRVSMHIVHEDMMDLELRDLVLPNAAYPVPSIMLIPEEELASEWLLWKRLTDIAVSFVALLVLAPLMLAIAIGIKVTTPQLTVLYPWHVVGYRGRRFTGYKFTTMVADADDRKASLAALNEMSGPVFKIENDPRVTSLGRFLRKYSLNELPQFWSVLKGDMSLVGPRPAGPHELVRYEAWHKRKLSVRPGITCFWQVRGRNKISNFDDWVKMDLEYIQKRSAATDMAILLKTVTVVLRGTGS